MKRFLLFLIFPAFVGCISHTSPLDEEATLIYIDDRPYEAIATLSSQDVEGTTYQVITIETSEQGRIRIMGPSFERGQFSMEHPSNSGFPYSLSYVDENERTGHYLGTQGLLEIKIIRSNAIEGIFEFKTTNMLSSCIECKSAKGPKVAGAFKAISM